MKRNIVTLFLLVGFFAYGQTEPYTDLDSLAVKLVRSLRSNMGENIFIHTDKSVYKAGEDLWFNAFLINKVSHKISHQSKIVFVDLVNDNDSVISQLILDARALRLDGKIPLAVGLADGNYWLRAYTHSILQGDSSDICVHPVYIVNPQNISMARTAVPAASFSSELVPRIDIFPEGGALIAGATCIVAVRITDQHNNPMETEGYVKDSRDSTEAVFKTSATGLGKFSIFPWVSRTYTIHIRTKDGHEFNFPVPATDNYAAALSVVGENDNSFRIRVSLGDSLYDKRTITYLLGVSRDSLCFAAIGEQMYETVIPKTSFPQGEATLLLFDEHKQLMSERSIYNDLNQAVVVMKPDKDDYLARQNVTLNVSVTDSSNRPHLSLLSASVTDDNNVKYFDDGDIEAITEEPYSPEERDLFMITQKNKYTKWTHADSTRARPTRLLKNLKPGAKDPGADENFFDIQGTVMNRRNEPLPHMAVTLVSTRPENIIEFDTTRANGRFYFPLNGYSDSTEFTLQASTMKGRIADVKIAFDSSMVPKFHTPAYLKKYLPEPAEKEIAQKKAEKPDFLLPGKGKVLKEVVVRTRVKPPVNYDERQRVSQFSRVLTPDMIKQNGDGALINSLLMVPGVQLRNRRLVLAGNDEEPLLVLDGVEMDSNALKAAMGIGLSPLMSFLNGLSPSTIDFIEVLTGGDGAFYGMVGGHGVIVVHSKASMGVDDSNRITLTKYYPTGYSSVPAFTEPDYSVREIRKNAGPDQRSTVYWSGPIITDNNGKATISFFTADPKTSYTVTIKGITVSGDIFLKRFTINRK